MLARTGLCSAISMGWQLAWQIWLAYWHDPEATWGSVCSVLLLDSDKEEQAFTTNTQHKTPAHTNAVYSYTTWWTAACVTSRVTFGMACLYAPTSILNIVWIYSHSNNVRCHNLCMTCNTTKYILTVIPVHSDVLYA